MSGTVLHVITASTCVNAHNKVGAIISLILYSWGNGASERGGGYMACKWLNGDFNLGLLDLRALEHSGTPLHAQSFTHSWFSSSLSVERSPVPHPMVGHTGPSKWALVPGITLTTRALAHCLCQPQPLNVLEGPEAEVPSACPASFPTIQLPSPIQNQWSPLLGDKPPDTSVLSIL